MTYYDKHDGTDLNDYELHERYDDLLDEIYPDETIAGMPITTSRALKEYDPIAYHLGFSDWLDAEIGETIVESLEETDDYDPDEPDTAP